MGLLGLAQPYCALLEYKGFAELVETVLFSKMGPC